MTFVQFCQSLGITMESEPPIGRWARYPTVDHPHKKNGAVKWLGDVGFAQNHSVMVDVAVWRPDESAPAIDMTRIHAQVAAQERKQREGWERAAKKAQAMVAEAKLAEHTYLHNKGFGETLGLVQDDALIVPMRHLINNAIVGAQVIRWDSESRRFEKKMIPGMRAKGAVFRLGSANAQRTWLVEGFATGLSVEAALRLRRLRDSVLICFSAGNLIHVAEQLQGEAGERVVFADQDESEAGERAAKKTGLPYVLPGEVGTDANDHHKRHGLFSLCKRMNTLSEKVVVT